MNKHIILFLVCFFYSISSTANELPQQLIVPGGIAIIPIAELNQALPTVFYKNNRVAVSKSKTHWLALIGIPLSAQAGEHKITVKTKNIHYQISFNVTDKDYPAQYLTIKKKRMVTGFTKADLTKINADKKAMSKAKSTWIDQVINTEFITPVDGRLSSLFGLKRFFNKIPKRPHNGLDIAAITGTAIIAPAPARVIDTGNYYFNGNTVFLDHGQGLLSA